MSISAKTFTFGSFSVKEDSRLLFAQATTVNLISIAPKSFEAP